MNIKQINCPCCGAMLKKKKFSRTYICQYCDNQFEADFIPKTISTNSTNNKRTSNVVMLLMAFVIVTVVIACIINSINSRNKETSDDEVSFKQNEYIDTSEEEPQFYDMPQSAYFQQMVSLIFEKPYEEVTKEDILKIRYLSLKKKFERNFMDDTYEIYYSFEDYKDYENPTDFNDTIKKVSVSEGILEKEEDYLDYACFSNLTYIDTFYIDERVLTKLNKLSACNISQINLESMLKYCDLDNIKEFTIDYGTKCENADFDGDIKYFDEVLRKMSNLESLCMECDKCKSLPEVVTNMKNLKSLSLYGADVINDYSFLNNFVNLEELVIDDGDYLKSLDFVNVMPKLTSLTLNGTAIISYELLRNNKTIKKLVVNYNDVDDVSPISTMTNLEHFESTLYSGDYTSFSKLHNMKYISISTNGTVPLDFLSGMTNLTEVSLFNCNLYGYVEALYGLQKLRKISVYYTDANVDFDNFMNIPNLEEIYIDGNDEGSVWIGNLLQMKKLKVLTIRNAALHMRFGDNLSMSGIEKLVLENIKLYKENQWESEKFSVVISMLATMKNIKELTLRNVNLEDVTDIVKLKSLEKIDVSCNYINSFDGIEKLDKLKSINIFANVATEINTNKDVCIYIDDGHIVRQKK